MLFAAGLFGCGEEGPATASDTSLIGNSASAEGEQRTDLPEISFEKEVHDFGMITQGERVNTEFTFTNTGNQL